MAYTQVPQGNQTIAATQVPILTNFAFIQTGLNKEHNFDATGTGSDMYHKFASMPNNADPGDPNPQNGTYFVKNDAPYFRGQGVNAIYSIVNAYPEANISSFRSGSLTVTTSPTAFFTVADNTLTYSGSFWLLRPGGSPYSYGMWVYTPTDGVRVAVVGSSVMGVTGSAGNAGTINVVNNGSGTFTGNWTVLVNRT
jgi:hypothetical protein